MEYATIERKEAVLEGVQVYHHRPCVDLKDAVGLKFRSYIAEVILSQIGIYLWYIVVLNISRTSYQSDSTIPFDYE